MKRVAKATVVRARDARQKECSVWPCWLSQIVVVLEPFVKQGYSADTSMLDNVNL